MKRICMIISILCCTVISTSCTADPERNALTAGTAESLSVSESAENTNENLENTDENFNMQNCMFDDGGKLLVKSEDGYVPYSYDRLPDTDGSLVRIIQMLRESGDIISLDYQDRLFLYYRLDEDKCKIVGSNDVDIFNFSIDKEQDVITFSVENLSFPGLSDDDYRLRLLETFRLLFGESGEDIYSYLMAFYEQPTDGLTDETRIDGMAVGYRCTPKHKLEISMAS